MRAIILVLLTSFATAIMAMPPMAPAINPAAVHTMHHSANVTLPTHNAAPSSTSPMLRVNSQNSTVKSTQYYESSVRGLRDYLNSIELQYPQVHAELDTQVIKLEDQKFNANAVKYGSWATAAVLVIGANTFLQKEETDTTYHLEQVGETPEGLPKHEFIADYKKRKVVNFDVIIASGLVLAAGAAISIWLHPDRNDIRNVINHHNRILPEEPLSLGFNYDLERNVPSFDLAYQF